MNTLLTLGAILITIGGICDLLGAIGLLKFPNFYVRLHAATVGTIGGAVVPLFGVAFLALGTNIPNKEAIAGASLITGLIILLAAPAGATALAYAAHKARIIEWKPKTDQLKEARK